MCLKSSFQRNHCNGKCILCVSLKCTYSQSFFLFFMYVLYTTLYISGINNKLKTKKRFAFLFKIQCQITLPLVYIFCHIMLLTKDTIQYTYSIQCIQNQSKIWKKQQLQVEGFIADLIGLLPSLISHLKGKVMSIVLTPPRSCRWSPAMWSPSLSPSRRSLLIQQIVILGQQLDGVGSELVLQNDGIGRESSGDSFS